VVAATILTPIEETIRRHLSGHRKALAQAKAATV
jgi:hypothetical protein